MTTLIKFNQKLKNSGQDKASDNQEWDSFLKEDNDDWQKKNNYDD